MTRPTTDLVIQSMAGRLSDPDALTKTCDEAGRILLDVVRSQPFDRLKAAIVALSHGLPLFKGLNREPPRPGDLTFTDHALAKRAELYRAIGSALKQEANHATTRSEQDDIDEFIDLMDLHSGIKAFTDKFDEADLDEMLDILKAISHPDGINLMEDDLMQGQSVKLDTVMFDQGQMFEAAADRLEDFVKYRPPDP